MDQETQAVKWHNIPITRVNTNYYDGSNATRTSKPKEAETRKQCNKRVTWNENLLEIRNISPRISKVPFKFQDRPSQPINDYSHPPDQSDHCRHFTCKADQPCRLRSNPESATNGYQSATKLNCSPQLQKVVNRARTIKQLPNHAEKTEYDWKPNRTNLTLNFHRLYDESRETMV